MAKRFLSVSLQPTKVLQGFVLGLWGLGSRGLGASFLQYISEDVGCFYGGERLRLRFLQFCPNTHNSIGNYLGPYIIVQTGFAS